MSIRFRCDKCGQKLRVSDDKAGLQAKCPKCKSALIVPAQTSPAENLEPDRNEPAPPANEAATRPVTVQVQPAPMIRVDDTDSLMLPEIVIRDDSEDWVREPSPNPVRDETLIDYDKVAVPRRVLYLQGGLLGVVALVSFVLGMLMSGGTATRQTAGIVAQPCVLSGQITYGDESRPDGGSVVIALPVDRRPTTDARVAIEGLRPGDPIPADDNISLRTIRSLGGDFVLANDEGHYQMRLPEQGRYHVLFISRRTARSGSDQLEVTDVAQIGRYFANVLDLIDDRNYEWRTLTLRADTTLDATF